MADSALKVAGNLFYATPWSESGVIMTISEIKAKSIETAVKVAEEGIVLLKNDGGSLPLASDGGEIKVNVFGSSSLDPEFAGGGAAIWDLISAGALNAEWNPTTDLYNADGSIRIAKMYERILEHAKAYSDVAVVFIHRAGSEGGNIGISDLTICESEAAMLEYVTANYDTVIVIFNTCNLMNMGWLDGVGDDQDISYGSYSYGGSVRREFGGGRGFSQSTTPRTDITYDEPHTYHIGECNSAMVIWSPGELGTNHYGENTVKVSVKVTNKGPCAGKDVIELYYSHPFYNDGIYGIEKSLIKLQPLRLPVRFPLLKS
jgi:hypothetical protein